MAHNDVIETIGSITKMENLLSFEQDVLQNTMVLKNVDPFPGYREQNANLSPGYKPGSIFIILHYRYAPEKINRINADAIKQRILRIYPSYGEIITRESILPCIRIKGIQHYNLIPSIQEFYKKRGLELMAAKEVSGMARIKIFKNFRIAEIADGLYRDLNEGEKTYIRIQKTLNWKRFEYITKKIKNHVSNRNFDAALGIIYRFCGPEDVVRIYEKDKTLERALELRKLYLKEVKKDMLISSNFHLPE